MCGISGIVSRGGVSPQVLVDMTRVLRHRGPDDEGYVFINEQGRLFSFRGDDTVPELSSLPHVQHAYADRFGVGISHRRLSIIDLSAAGHQPMVVEEGRWVVAFNGEIYNFECIRDELIENGFQFVSQSDTEVLLAAYAAWGEDCVQKFVGMWAFAIIDRVQNTLFLSRDRFGIKPLYYVATDEHFAFSSEIKGLLNVSGSRPQVQEEAQLQYLFYGTLSEPGVTLFQGVREVLPAHHLVYDLDSHTFINKRYYDIHSLVANQNPINEQCNPVAEYRELLARSVDLHLRSDVEVGSCLSGGLDSSALVSFAAPRMKNVHFNTFTAAYQEPEADESDYVKMISGHYNNIRSFFVYPSAKEYWSELDRMTWHQDLPVGSTSVYAQWAVMKLASQQKTKVLLDGQGADEVIGGYANFTGVFMLDLLKSWRIHNWFRNAKALREHRSVRVWHEIGRAGFHGLPHMLKYWVWQKKRAGADLFETAHRENLAQLTVPHRGGATFLEACLNAIHTGLQALLRYEDRNSMAFSIESRVPFLDHRFVEFILRLPQHYKMNDGWSKFIQRKAIESRLPEAVVWRRDKMGFVTPQSSWKETLVEDIFAFLRDSTPPDCVSKSYYRTLLNSEPSPQLLQGELWRLVVLMKWRQVFGLNGW